MSINDILNDDNFLIMLFGFLLIVLIFAIPLGRVIRRKTDEGIYSDSASGSIKEENNVKVVAKRTEPHPLNNATMIYMVMFEFENGNRIELAIKDSYTFGSIIEGDCGTLRHIEKKFLSFRRNS